MTLAAMMLELAEDVGLAYYGADGRQAPSLPQDAGSLAKLRSYVNKGYREFLAADPRWSFTRTTEELELSPDGTGPRNIDGDPARYRLPPYMRGIPASTPAYIDQISSITHCALRDASTVLRNIQAIKASGVPRMCAVRPIPNPGGITSAEHTHYEMIFYPAPDAKYRLSWLVRVHPYSLVDDNEPHVAGSEHDRAIMAAVSKCWRDKFSDDPGEIANAVREWVNLLEASRANDRETRTRNFGRMTDPSICVDERSRRGRGLITHSNGTPIP